MLLEVQKRDGVETIIHCRWICCLLHSLEINMQTPSENKIKLPYLHSYAHCSIIHNSQNMDTTQVSKNRLLGKENI